MYIITCYLSGLVSWQNLVGWPRHFRLKIRTNINSNSIVAGIMWMILYFIYFSNIFLIVHIHVEIFIFMYKEVILHAVNIFLMFILSKGHLLFLQKMIVMFATRKKVILKKFISFYFYARSWEKIEIWCKNLPSLLERFESSTFLRFNLRLWNKLIVTSSHVSLK